MAYYPGNICSKHNAVTSSVTNIFCSLCEKEKLDRLRCSICSANCATDCNHYCNVCDKEKTMQMESKINFLQMKWQPEAIKDYASDLILLQAADGECVPVNNFILVSRSRVFEVMLKANMIERQTKTIKLEDVNAPILRSFISFLYSAHVSDQELQQHSTALLLAANKYDVDLLKRTCENFMIKNLSKDCVFSYLEVAYLCDSILLKNTAFDFISKEYIQYQLGEGLLNLANKHPRLIVELCSHLIDASSKSANAKTPIRVLGNGRGSGGIR